MDEHDSFWIDCLPIRPANNLGHMLVN